jgi:hypothetical protein
MSVTPSARLEHRAAFEQPHGIGGFRIIFGIHGQARTRLKYGQASIESACWRPKAGRIHTSTATVAVLPEAEGSTCGSATAAAHRYLPLGAGHGGQTSEGRVGGAPHRKPTRRLLPGRAFAPKNKTKAMSVLRARLLAQAAGAARGDGGRDDPRSGRAALEKIARTTATRDRPSLGLMLHNLRAFSRRDRRLIDAVARTAAKPLEKDVKLGEALREAR